MRYLPLLPLALALLAGCGPDPNKPADDRPSITVRGKLMSGPKPWALDETKVKLPPGTSAPPVAPGQSGGGGVKMEFVSAEGGETVPAEVDATAGTFTAKGLKAGRYKIALTGAGPGAADPFGGKFTRDTTKIVRDLKDGDELTIDVTKPGG